MGTEWDAATYGRVSAPQFAWGSRIVERVPLRGDEDVLDAGCGTGRVTRLLAERVPDGTVLGVDGSHRMVEEASAQLADLAPRVRFMQADLTALTLPEPVDAIVSTATFHWILDHDLLFRRLFAALRPGGLLVAQCGGDGNIARTLAAADAVAAREPYAAHLAGMPQSWYFAGPEATEARLARAGFIEAHAGLEDADTPFDDPEAAAEFLSTVVLRHHLERLPEALRMPFARDVAALRAADDPAGRVVLDYVRLNLEARRPALEA
ncbi:MAG TPA: methyltransferase domain-containing protein [Miltoncostaea sp.]|nr:methyltransferase domain-containing protein [Miltoncostaea sp.]